MMVNVIMSWYKSTGVEPKVQVKVNKSNQKQEKKILENKHGKYYHNIVSNADDKVRTLLPFCLFNVTRLCMNYIHLLRSLY